MQPEILGLSSIKPRACNGRLGSYRYRYHSNFLVRKYNWFYNHDRIPSAIKVVDEITVRTNDSTQSEHNTDITCCKKQDEQYLLFGPKDGHILVQKMRKPTVGRWDEVRGFFEWSKVEVFLGGSERGQMRAETKCYMWVKRQAVGLTDRKTDKQKQLIHEPFKLRLLSHQMISQERRCKSIKVAASW